MSRSTARVILGQVLNIAIFGSQNPTEVTDCVQMPKLLTTPTPRTSLVRKKHPFSDIQEIQWNPFSVILSFHQ